MMRTRHAVLLLALLGSFGAAALAIAAHRLQLNLDLAQRIGGDEARNALQASMRFGPVQELGLLGLALIFLALFLLQMSLQAERLATEKQHALGRIEVPPAEVPRALVVSAPAVEVMQPESALTAPVTVAISEVPAAATEEGATPHA